MKRIVRIFGGAVFISVALVTTPFAYAASGWYLLIPPLSEYIEREAYSGEYKILDTKPLSQWAHHGSYDKASECERAKLALRSGLYGISAESSGDWSKAHDAKHSSEVLKKMWMKSQLDQANVNAGNTSRCIKSDEPRLGK